jgi:Flp pilus assembly protein TadD
LKKAEQEKKEAAKKRKLAEEDAMHLQQSDAYNNESGTEVETNPNEAGDTLSRKRVSTPADLSLEPMDAESAVQDKDSENVISDEGHEPDESVSIDPDKSNPELNTSPVDVQEIGDTAFSEDVTIKANTGEYKSRVISNDDYKSLTQKSAIDSANISLEDVDLSNDIASHEDSEGYLPDEVPGVGGSGEHKKPDLELSGSYPRPALDPDQTFNGLDMEKAFGSNAFKDMQRSDSSMSDDLDSTYEETLPGISASELANDLGILDQPTPVAAETIFSATGANSRPSTGYRILMVTLTVVMLCAAGIAVYYYVTPINRNIPSPTVARGVETIITDPVINESTTNTNVTLNVPDNTAAGSNVTDPVPVNEAVPAGIELNTTVIEQTNIQPDDAQQLVADDPVEPEVDIPATPSGVQESLTLPVNTNLPEVIEPPPSMVRLTRSRGGVSNAPNRLIQEAYQAYQAGDYPLAEQKYLEAYRQLPENRDVLLGMAAISVQNGNNAQALDIYLKLLRLNPMDNVARAAVLGYRSGDDGTTTDSISAIKSMVYEYPDEPSLYFNLGKLYASRSSWAEAQQAFFDAYRLDSDNPDYALNLAVSLDRLGQKQAALEYYNTAVNLTGDSPAGFETQKVLTRIRTLTSGN